MEALEAFGNPEQKLKARTHSGAGYDSACGDPDQCAQRYGIDLVCNGLDNISVTSVAFTYQIGDAATLPSLGAKSPQRAGQSVTVPRPGICPPWTTVPIPLLLWSATANGNQTEKNHDYRETQSCGLHMGER